MTIPTIAPADKPLLLDPEGSSENNGIESIPNELVESAKWEMSHTSIVVVVIVVIVIVIIVIIVVVVVVMVVIVNTITISLELL